MSPLESPLQKMKNPFLNIPTRRRSLRSAVSFRARATTRAGLSLLFICGLVFIFKEAKCSKYSCISRVGFGDSKSGWKKSPFVGGGAVIPQQDKAKQEKVQWIEGIGWTGKWTPPKSPPSNDQDNRKIPSTPDQQELLKSIPVSDELLSAQTMQGMPWDNFNPIVPPPNPPPRPAQNKPAAAFDPDEVFTPGEGELIQPAPKEVKIANPMAPISYENILPSAEYNVNKVEGGDTTLNKAIEKVGETSNPSESTVDAGVKPNPEPWITVYEAPASPTPPTPDNKSEAEDKTALVMQVNAEKKPNWGQGVGQGMGQGVGQGVGQGGGHGEAQENPVQAPKPETGTGKVEHKAMAENAGGLGLGTMNMGSMGGMGGMELVVI